MRAWHGVFMALWLWTSPAPAADVYQTPEAFLEDAFDGDVPAPDAIWLTRDLRGTVAEILDRKPSGLRIRYWRRGARTAWILEDIGKYEPITTGVMVDSGRLARIKVLIYRESRGWQVRHDWFTRQFEGARLTGDRELDRQIDGISGATLSVRALREIATLALFLDRRVREDG